MNTHRPSAGLRGAGVAVVCALLSSACGVAAQPAGQATPLPVRFAATSPAQASAQIAAAQATADADPKNVDAWRLLGNALSAAAAGEADAAARRSRYDAAIAAYQRALELQPANAAVLHNLGTAHLQLGDLASARKNFEAALAVEADDPTTLYMLGTIYLQEDPFGSPQTNQRAREKFEAAVRIDPKLAVAYVGLAQVYFNEGDTARALENARRGVELSGEDVDPYTYWQLAQAQCASGDAAAGAETLNRILAIGAPNEMFIQQVRLMLESCK